MEPTESSETSAFNVTWAPGTYPKDNKLGVFIYRSLVWYVDWRTALAL